MFISMNIIKQSGIQHEVDHDSNSNSSFSVESNVQINGVMRPFEIEEESNEDDSRRMSNLKLPADLSIENSINNSHHSKRKHYDEYGLASNTSSMNNEQKNRFNEQLKVINAEKTHFDFHNLFLIFKCCLLVGHWYYHSSRDPSPYSSCSQDHPNSRAVNCK